jgi:hypothetical protein
VLAALRKSRREVVAALNKIDRLKPGELEVVKDALRRSMPELTRDAIGVSARGALKARLAEDDVALVASGFPSHGAPRTEVFSPPAPSSAAPAVAGSRSSRTLASEPTSCAASGLRGGRGHETEALPGSKGGLADDIEGAITQMESGQASAFHEAAREVLGFVRPRANRFAAHGADPEDRAFLRETMEGRLEAVGEAAAASLLAALTLRLEGVLATSTPLSPERLRTLELRVRAAITPPIAAFAGYQSGLLGGGELRRFFDEVLPHVELSLGPLTEALAHARAHPRELLKPALEAATASLVRELQRESERRAIQSERHELELVARRFEPLRVLHEVLSALVGGERLAPASRGGRAVTTDSPSREEPRSAIPVPGFLGVYSPRPAVRDLPMAIAPAR